jgi:5-methylcytosine-specific restriction enzyme A
MWWRERYIKQLKEADKKRMFSDVSNDRKEKRQHFQEMYQDTSWKKLRKWHIDTHPYCEMCLKKDKITKAFLVHHIKPAMDFPELFLEPTNLESACLPCHSTHEWKEAKERRRLRKLANGKKLMEQLMTKPK